MTSTKVTESVVNNLDPYDLDAAIELLDSLDLDSDDVEDVEEAQRRLKIYISQHADGTGSASVPGVYSTWNAQTSSEVVQKIIADNTNARTSLQRSVTDIRSFVNRLPKPRLDDLHEVFPQAESDIENVISNLNRDECVILVAGETGAGKSTLLNLLLGELSKALLPTAHLSSTSVITELKYGKNKKMMVYYKSDDLLPESVDLSHNAANVLSEYVHQKGDRSERFAYKRVEVYWPCDWLKGGITIVDTPGVGEDADLTEMVKEYLPKAFAFIYVINTPLAGGIDPDRLQDLMFSHITQQNQTAGRFNPNSAIFVCNKWEEIPQKETEKVKCYIMDKLHIIWPGFKQDQVFFISATRTIQEIRDGILSSNYRGLLNGIEKLIPVGLKSKLGENFSIASNILKRSNFLLRAYIMDNEGETDNKLDRIRNAQKRLLEIEDKPMAIKDEMKKKMMAEIDNAITKLISYLKRKEVKERMSFWKRSDCPKSSKSLDHLLELMQGKAQKRIKIEVDAWDRDNNIFKSVYDEVLATFKSKFFGIEQELKRIEENLARGKDERESGLFHYLAEISKHGEQNDDLFSTKEKVVIGLTSPLWVPLGLLVGLLALPFFGGLAFHIKRKEAKEKSRIEENIEKEMGRVTLTILESMTTSGKIKELVQEKTSHMLATFNEMIDRMPEIIKADKRLLSQMQKEIVISSEDLKNIYHPLYMEGTKLQSEIDCLYVKDIRSYDIDIDDLSDSWELGEGSFATVFKATWRPDHLKPPITVALKRFNDPITSQNATELLAEEANLREIKSPNIVSYYGTYVVRVQEHVFPVLVMEYCTSSLDKVIESETYKAPGKYLHRADYNRAVTEAATYGWQISCGLMAMHSMGFAHRDMKPENILVSVNGNIKLADLGLTKRVALMKRTLLGTPLYMAPEVILDEPQTEKADIFGLAMVLWELWYGCCVIEEISKHDPLGLGDNLTALVKCIKMFVEDPYPAPRCPPDYAWSDLLQKCWSLDPSKRPSALKCCLALRNGFLNK